MSTTDTSERFTPREGDETNSFKLRRSPEAMLAVFAETNEHMRNAEQKQLSITGAYLGMVAVVLSLLPGGGMTLIAPRPASAWVYLFLLVIGCCVFLLQAWCRVWKEHYLQILKRIAQTWLLPEEYLPYWLRNLPPSPKRAHFKINVDNTLVYFTFLMNTILVGLVVHQAMLLLSPALAYAVLAFVMASYVLFLVGVDRLVQNRRDVLEA